MSIEFARSYKVDLSRGIYTTYFMARAPSDVHFSLTEEEKNKILDKYYSLKLDKEGETIVRDNCNSLPKLNTTIYAKSQKLAHKIIIDTGCNDYRNNDSLLAKEIKDMISLIRNIIYSKTEIKNAKESDILYY